MSSDPSILCAFPPKHLIDLRGVCKLAFLHFPHNVLYLNGLYGGDKSLVVHTLEH